MTYTDAQGHYQFRVGPGRYELATARVDDSESVPVDVQNQEEIVHDLAIKARARETYLSGVVVEKTATGERPVGGALAFRWPVCGLPRTDEQGRFMVERTPGETTFYTFCPASRSPASLPFPPALKVRKLIALPEPARLPDG